MTARFASMLSYLGATAFQLFIYCWFGNEMMLEVMISAILFCLFTSTTFQIIFIYILSQYNIRVCRWLTRPGTVNGTIDYHLDVITTVY